MSLKKIFALISLSTILLFLSYSLYSTFVSVSASENTYTNYYNLSESEQYILNHHWYGHPFFEPVEFVFSVDKNGNKTYTQKIGNKNKDGLWRIENNIMILDNKIEFHISKDTNDHNEFELMSTENGIESIFTTNPKNAEPFVASEVNNTVKPEMFNGKWNVAFVKSGEATGRASIFFVDDIIFEIKDSNASFSAKINNPSQYTEQDSIKINYEKNCIKCSISENVKLTGYILNDGMLELKLKDNGHSSTLWMKKNKT